MSLVGEHRGAEYSTCNSKYNTPKEIPIVFHDRSNYDYHFIIKELAEKFEEQFTCLGKNTEKCITLSVPIAKKSLKNCWKRKKITKTIFYRLQFNDSATWQAHYQILLITLLKEFIKLVVNMAITIKNA